MRPAALVRVVLLCGVLSACGGALRAPASTPVSATAERDGVRVTLSLQRDRYAPGDEVWADVAIENTNDHPVVWTGGGCNIPSRVTAAMPAGDSGGSWPGALGAWKTGLLEEEPHKISFIPEGHWPAFKRGEAMFCTADIRLVELGARSTLHTKAGWDGTLPYEHRLRAPDGRYEIDAVFPLGHWDTPKAVSVSAPIELIGGAAATVSRGQALDATLSHAGFRSWLEQRLAQQTPDAQVSSSLILEDTVWRLRVGQRIGRPGGIQGHEADARIDARTGQLLEVVFGGRP